MSLHLMSPLSWSLRPRSNPGEAACLLQEILVGKHRRRRLLPPKVPLHPSASAAATAAARAAPGATAPAAPQQDMTLFEAYRDLQLRWKRTTR